MTYNILDIFHFEGYFSIKTTPLGANMFLMEEGEYGELHALLNEAKDLLSQWIVKIRE